MLATYASLLRVQQYVKNLFVFAPLLFSFHYSLPGTLRSIAAFVLFSLLASSIYIINDYLDIAEDRQHPTKRQRPLASGAIQPGSALLICGCLAITALTGGFLLDVNGGFLLLAYFLLNIAYSYKLKKVVIVDIFIIATGFVLRIFVGGVACGEPISMWLVIMTFLLALFLAVAKRRDDVLLSQAGRQTRKNIDGYTLQFVDTTMTLMAGVIIVSYILYTVSADVIERLQTEHLYLTALFVILGIMRYMQVTIVEGRSGSPTKIVLTDTFLQTTIILWLASFFTIAFI